MTCDRDEYSELDEHIDIDSMKRVVENAVSTIAGLVNSTEVEEMLKGSRPFNPEAIRYHLEYLDVARVALVAMRKELDSCTMVGTKMEHSAREAEHEAAPAHVRREAEHEAAPAHVRVVGMHEDLYDPVDGRSGRWELEDDND